MIEIHPNARISKFADIEDSVRGSKIQIKSNAVIDSFVKIKPVGGIGDLVIGEFSIINSGCVIYTGNGVFIGRSVAVAANCTFAPTNHAYKDKNRLISQQGFLESKGGIIVDDDVWIGSGSTILDGARIRKGVVIGAGSVVRGELLEYGIYMGNPLLFKGFRE